MKFSLMSGVSAAALGFAVVSSPAMAGNIVLTGHDNDFHCSAGTTSTACGALAAEVKFAENGSTLPILAIDAGSELTSSLTKDGFSFVKIAPSAVTAASFDFTKYSAFAVASVSSCGGCDNPVGTGTKLSAFSTAIAAFVTAGGGIVGLTSASDTAGYSYIPSSTGATTAIFSSSGFVATGDASLIAGFSAVNGDQTHNQFSAPGTSGVSSSYKVLETFGAGGPPITLAVGNATVTGTGITSKGVPEPVSLSILGAGLFGLAAARRRAKTSV